jgi:hypothetical protein
MPSILDGGSISIEFDHGPNDVVALRRFYLDEYTNGRKRRRNYIWGAACITAVAIGLAMSSLEWRFDWKKNLIIPVVFAPSILLVTGGIAARLIYLESTSALMKQALREKDHLGPTDRYGPRRMTFDRDGYRLFGDGHEHALEWRCVPAVLRDFDHLYLCHHASRQRIAAVIVPGRAFATQATFDEFCAEIMKTWRAARVEDVLRDDSQQRSPSVITGI